ncbi:MAG: hypothetical protein U0V48_09930 [Anaerolineales bacterium]
MNVCNAACWRLFITVPDLTDSLRFAYADPETTFEERFETIRNADLLVMDDFGTQNATPWAQENYSRSSTPATSTNCRRSSRPI